MRLLRDVHLTKQNPEDYGLPVYGVKIRQKAGAIRGILK